MADSFDLNQSHAGSRREFLRRTFAFSAVAALAPGALLAQAAGTTDSPLPDPAHPHLLLVGDWGTDKYIQQQQQVANGMKRYVDVRNVHPGANIYLGDNWYGTMTGVDSTRWQTQFEQMYPDSHFPGPAWAVLGNHDYERRVVNKVDMQLSYAAKVKGGSRWRMPGRWYTFNYPETNPMIKFIALDSNLPHTQDHDMLWNFTMSKDHVAEQDAFLRAELAKSRTTPFVGIICHHPLYTNGVHKDNPILIQAWDALLRQYKVDFYMTGHDHDLQHLEFAGHPTSFIISGGGGAELVDWSIPPEKRGPFGARVLGFSHMEFERSAIVFRHLDQDAKEIHAFRKTPDGKVDILRPRLS